MDFFAFDIPTLLMVNFYISILIVAGLSFYLWERQVCPGMYHWVVGMAMVALGLFFLLFRVIAPLPISILVGNGLILIGLICFWLGIRVFSMKIKHRDYYVLIIGPITAIGLLLALNWGVSELVRAQIYSWVIISIQLLGLHAALDERAKSEYGRLLLAFVLLISCFNSVLRIYTLQHGRSFTILNPELSNLICMLNATFLMLGACFSFMSIGSQWLQHKVSVHAMFDSLTGIYNQYGLSQQSALFFHPGSIMSNMKRCVLVIEIDHFRQIHDKYGHQISDTVLKQVATKIRQNIRSEDIFARYAGDEFVVILPETTGQSAKMWSERVRNIVSSTNIKVNMFDIPITLTIGVVELHEGKNLDMNEAIRLAQQSLNHAKRLGKNQIHLSKAAEL